jgi:hypothetical protein
MTYEPKPGDRIRQTIVREGVVQPEGRLAVTDDGGRFSVDPDAYSSSVTNELVEPHYPVGSLWMDANGATLERGDNPYWPWCNPVSKSTTYRETYATRPLIRLYREGEQSTGAES